MRFDNGVTAKELQLERNLNKTAIDRKDSELMALSMTLQQTVEENSILKSELRKIGGGIDKNAIATLQTELDKIKGELVEKEQAIAKLKSELERAAGELEEVKAIAKPEPNPDTSQPPTPEPEPESNPEQPDTTGTLTRGELIKHILEKFPDSKINGQNITDAIGRKSLKLSTYESDYGFKYLGKIDGVNRFQLINKA